MIKICIIDPQEISRHGLALLLDKQKDFQIVSTYAGTIPLLQQLPALECDILISTVFLENSDVIALLRQIHQIKPSQKTILLALKGGRTYAQQLSDLHLAVFCIEDTVDELMKLIRAVHSNKNTRVKTVDLTKNKDIFPLSIAETDPNRVLTKREMEILNLIYMQYSNKEIAQHLFISASTVETHRKNIIYKLGANNTIGLIKYVLENNVFSSSSQEELAKAID